MAHVALSCRNCGNGRRVDASRELCRDCSALSRWSIREGLTTWAKLESLGLCAKPIPMDRRKGKTVAAVVKVDPPKEPPRRKVEPMTKTIGDSPIRALTIRESLAAAAMVGLLASEGSICVPGREVAKAAVDHADMLIDELNRKEGGA